MTLDELDFKLIIDDSEFNKQVADILKAAQDLNVTLTDILNIKKGISVVSKTDVENAKNANKILKDTAKTEEEIRKNAAFRAAETSAKKVREEASAAASVAASREKEAREVLKTQMAQERLVKLQKENNQGLLASGKIWTQLKNLTTAYFSVMGAKTLVSNLVRVSAEFEYQEVTLAAIIQDANKAEHIFEQIKDLSVQSPFAFKDLVSYVKQLSAFSIPVDELYETTKMLADVSSGLGVSMDRIVLAYGQIRSASFLRGQEVRQLTEAGIPILEELRKQFVALGEEGITVGDVFDKISSRLVPFEMVEKVFKDMTSEGGKFYKMQEVQADTLKGKIMNLKDAYQIMFAEIGEKNSGFLKGSVDALRNLALNYQKVGRAITDVIALYGAYKAALAVHKVLEEAVLLAGIRRTATTKQLGNAIRILTAESKGLLAVNKILAAIDPYALIAAGIIAISAHFISASVQAARFKKELDGIVTSQVNMAEKSAKGFDDLVKRLEGATKGSQRYRDAISELNRKYGEYLPNLLNEKNALTEVAKAHDQVTAAIYAQARAYAESQGQQKIEDRYGTEFGKASKALYDYLVKSGIGTQAAEEFVQGLRNAFETDFSGDVAEIYKKSFGQYFGEEIIDPFKKASVDTWNLYIERFAEGARSLRKADEDFRQTLDLRFGSQGYSSLAERDAIEPVIQKYSVLREKIMNQQLSEEETQNKLLDNERDKLTEILEVYKQLNKELEGTPQTGAWNNKINETLEALDKLKPTDLSWLQKVVNPLVTGKGNNDLKAQDVDQYNEYLDNLRKAYKETSQEFEDATKTYNKYIADKKRGAEVDEKVFANIESQYNRLKERKSVIENIGRALGVSIDDKISGGKGKSNEQTALEIRISTLKDLLSWYEKFKEVGADDKSIREILTTYFPDEADVIAGQRYKEVLLELADAVEKYDKKAAQALRDDMGITGLSGELEKLKKIKKTMEDYDNFMANWFEESELEGEGVAFKVSTIVANYRKRLQEIEKKKQEAREKLYAREDAQTPGSRYGLDFAHEFNEINKRALRDENNALAKYSEDARKAIESFYKEARDGSVDFSNLSDKSINQLRRMKDQISELLYAEYSPETIKQLNELGFSLDDIIAALEKMAEEDLEKLDLEIDEKEVSKWKGIAENILEVADALGKLGEESGNQGLVDFAEVASTIGDVAKNALQGFASGGVAGAVVAGVSTLAVKFLEVATNAEKVKNELREITTQRYLEDLSNQIASASTIFGESWMNKIQQIRDAIGELQKKIGELGKSTYGKSYAGPTALTTVLSEYAEKLGMEMFEENGTFNTAFLEAVDAAYQKALKRIGLYDEFSELKQYNDQVQSLLKDFDAAVEDMFGNLGESITDELIDKLWQTGEAVTDLEGTFQDLGNTIMKSLINSFVIDEILAKYKEQVKSWWTADMSADEIASQMEDFATNVRGDIEKANDIIVGIFNAFASRDLISNGEASENTLANGIKGITEETASLLASYVNAIRADVAAGRLQWEDMAANVRLMLGLLPQTPTLAEYLTQIQANTFNTAERTREIMERLELITTSEGGAAAFRVFM